MVLRKTCFQISLEFIKKSVIYKEKSGTVTKIKLRRFEQYNQLYFEILVIARTVIVEITHKIRTSLKTLVSKKAKTWRLKKSQSKDKLL